MTGDLPEVRPHFVKAASRITSAAISPTGLRAVFAARGEILTVPAERGDIRNLTNTPGVNERSPAWSPDGSRIAYFSDESGEYALHIRKQDGTGEVQKIDLGSPGSFYFNPRWSPDNKKIAYTDKRLNLWYVDLQNGKPVHVFRDVFTGPQQIMEAAWSPDSKWLAYTKQGKSHMRSVWLYSLAAAQSQQITDGMSDEWSPVFDHNGKYLYLLSSTDAGPQMDTSLASYNKPSTASVYVVVLSKDVPSPLAPESDDEAVAAADTPRSEAGGAKRETWSRSITRRSDSEYSPCLCPPRNYVELQPGKDGSGVRHRSRRVGSGSASGQIDGYRFDFKGRKTDRIVRRHNVLRGLGEWRKDAVSNGRRPRPPEHRPPRSNGSSPQPRPRLRPEPLLLLQQAHVRERRS